MKVLTISQKDKSKFDQEIADAIKDGYKVQSTSCDNGFSQSWQKRKMGLIKASENVVGYYMPDAMVRPHRNLVITPGEMTVHRMQKDVLQIGVSAS